MKSERSEVFDIMFEDMERKPDYRLHHIKLDMASKILQKVRDLGLSQDQVSDMSCLEYKKIQKILDLDGKLKVKDLVQLATELGIKFKVSSQNI